jgi:hypothetical protein
MKQIFVTSPNPLTVVLLFQESGTEKIMLNYPPSLLGYVNPCFPLCPSSFYGVNSGPAQSFVYTICAVCLQQTFLHMLLCSHTVFKLVILTFDLLLGTVDHYFL